MRLSLVLPLALSLVGLVGVHGCEDDPTPTPSGIDLEWVTEHDTYPAGSLLSIWSSGPDEVWMVGGQPDASLALSWDGSAWTRHDPGVGHQLWWVHGFEGGPVYVVGDRGVAARYQDGAWEPLDTGLSGTTLYGIWGAAPDDLWAVGGPSARAPADEREGDVVLHFDGQSWQRQTIQALLDKPDSAGKNIFKVWGTSADHAVIVGDSGLVLVWDGSTWERQDSGAAGETLFTVWGRGPDDVYAVGGLGAPVMIHWDGAAWNRIELPAEAPQVIQGVWTAPGQPVYVAGWYGFTARYDADGTWQVGDSETPNAYHAISSDGEGLWAVGGNIYALIAEYDGLVASTHEGVVAPP